MQILTKKGLQDADHMKNHHGIRKYYHTIKIKYTPKEEVIFIGNFYRNSMPIFNADIQCEYKL